MSNIKFGTDGWRAVIGKDFTPENIAKIIQAFADIYPNLPEAGRPVVVGYDRRNKSEESAKLVAEVLTGNGINTILSSQFCPTPGVSWTVVKNNAAAGVMITASHNPADWNGIKFKESYGGAACSDYTTPIEEQIVLNTKNNREIKKKTFPNDMCSSFDPKKEYLDALKQFVDLKAIRDLNFKILVDTLYGAGSDFFPEIIGSDITQIHTAADNTFGGLSPEPIPPHVNEAIEKTKAGGYDVCLLTDGDADRIGAVDENGRFVSPHQIFSLILKHFVEDRGLSGRVIKSLTTTRMINRLCNKYGLKLTTTSVGFKYICPILKEPGVLMGGEESGGIGIPQHVCERDGLLCGLILLEIMAKREKRLGELVEELQKEVGPCFYKRIDLRLDDATVTRAKARLEALEPKELAGRKVAEISRMDGYHFLRDDESWLLVRTSGTEPLLRIYSEAATPEDVDKLLNLGKEFIGI
jgi:phosphomannomutase